MTKIVPPAEFYDRLADIYDSWFLSGSYPLPASEEKAFLKPLLEGCRDILDVACGTGRTDAMLSRDFNIVGIDISEKMLRKAAQRTRVVRAHSSALPFRDESFDAVISLFAGFCYALTESDVRKIAYEMARVTRKGGVLVIDSPNRYKTNDFVDADRGLFIFRDGAREIATRYTLHSKEALLRSSKTWDTRCWRYLVSTRVVLLITKTQDG